MVSRTLPPDGANPSQARSRPIRVLVADDHAILREGLVQLLEECPSTQVVAEAADGEEAIGLSQRLKPDVVIMDVTMPRLSGIEATRRLHAMMPQVRIIGLSMHGQEVMGVMMRQAGAEAYLVKDGRSEPLLRAILTPPAAA